MDDTVVPEWRIAIREPIEVFDEYTASTVALVPGQTNPNEIEGLIVDFRYVAANGEMSRRSLLCWQCGRAGGRIYVRGYCPFREDLRTFRIDRMQDVIAFQRGRQLTVDDVQEFFAAFAANSTEDEGEMLRLAARDG